MTRSSRLPAVPIVGAVEGPDVAQQSVMPRHADHKVSPIVMNACFNPDQTKQRAIRWWLICVNHSQTMFPIREFLGGGLGAIHIGEQCHAASIEVLMVTGVTHKIKNKVKQSRKCRQCKHVLCVLIVSDKSRKSGRPHKHDDEHQEPVTAIEEPSTRRVVCGIRAQRENQILQIQSRRRHQSSGSPPLSGRTGAGVRGGRPLLGFAFSSNVSGSVLGFGGFELACHVSPFMNLVLQRVAHFQLGARHCGEWRCEESAGNARRTTRSGLVAPVPGCLGGDAFPVVHPCGRGRVYPAHCGAPFQNDRFLRRSTDRHPFLLVLLGDFSIRSRRARGGSDSSSRPKVYHRLSVAALQCHHGGDHRRARPKHGQTYWPSPGFAFPPPTAEE